jgi:hypothetical protein
VAHTDARVDDIDARVGASTVVEDVVSLTARLVRDASKVPCGSTLGNQGPLLHVVHCGHRGVDFGILLNVIDLLYVNF